MNAVWTVPTVAPRSSWRRWAAWWAVWAVLVALAAGARAPLPIDETRYLGVAWEMWRDGRWLVPHLNGETYAHKPPLLFWGIGAAWKLFGVGAGVARLVPAAAGLGCLLLTASLAKALWPADRDAVMLAPTVLASTLWWAAFTGALMFDIVLTLFVLGAVRALLAYRAGGLHRHWVLAGISIGAGLLAKGPVVLVHVLPIALLLPWCPGASAVGDGHRWYAALGGATLLGAAIGLAWALPAAFAGGDAYRQALLFDQTAGRMAGSFAHARPWWWYAPLLPVVLAPWFAWPGLWRGAGRSPSRGRSEPGTRVALVWLGAGLVCFSAISGKQPHYLLPLCPAFALLVARRLSSMTHVRRTDRLPAVAMAAIVGLALIALPPLGAENPSLGSMRESIVAVSPLWGLGLVAAAVVFAALPVRTVGTPFGLATGAAGLGAASVAAIALALAPVLSHNLDVRPLAHRVGELQRGGVDVAWAGRYAGELGFAGQLLRPVEVVDEGSVREWTVAHPHGAVVVPLDERPADPFDSPFRDVFAYRDRYRRLVASSRYAADAHPTDLPVPALPQDHDS